MLQTGQSILHYRVLLKLGKGGMGEVYQAEDMKLGRMVAIKVLSLEMARDETAKKRFLQEARSASALNHPNIVTVHSIEDTGDMSFIVMEYVRGLTLKDQLGQGSLEIKQLLEFGVQIADAIGAAHSIGLIHRDLKPSNIVITPKGQAKVLDFGISKVLRAVSQSSSDGETRTDSLNLTPQDLTSSVSLDLTEAGSVMGTIPYMSPEQTRGEPLDTRTDVFSLGSVLYEAATGRLPFQGAGAVAIMQNISAADPIPPSVINPSLPQSLDLLLNHALAKNKEERYATAGELADALRTLKDAVFQTGTISIPTGANVAEAGAFVGREDELLKLSDLVDGTVHGSGKIAFITGEPGIGKTALLDQFLRRTRQKFASPIVWRGRCIETYGAGEAYLPFLDALSALMSSSGKERVLTALRRHAPTWYLQLPSGVQSDRATDRLKLETMGANKERMLHEMSTAISAMAESSLVVLTLEDLHWADPSSIDLLRHLSHKMQGKILIIGTFRLSELPQNQPLKNYRNELAGRALCTELNLSELKPDHVTAFVDVQYSPNAFPREFFSFLHKKTDGNPLFAVSLLRYLAEQGDLIKAEDRWVLTRPISDLEPEVPESIREMIRTKVESLEEEDRKALQYASVEGEEFSSAVVADILQVEEVDLQERLDTLEKTYYFVKTIGEEELPDGALVTRYRFSHALFQNFLYSDLVSKRRILLHRKVGESLLQHYGDKVQRIAAQLASHFQRGRDFPRAVEFLEKAGDNARNLYANAEAMQHYSEALELMEKIPAENKTQIMPRLLESNGDVLELGGQHEKARETYRLGLSQVLAPDPIRLSNFHRKIAKTLLFQEALQAYGVAEEVLGSRPQDPSKDWWRAWLQIQVDKMWVLYGMNRGEELLKLTEGTRTDLQLHGTPAQQAGFYFGTALIGLRTDRYTGSEVSLKVYEDYLEASIAAGPQATAAARFGLGFCYLWRGELEIAEEHLHASLSIAQKLGDLAQTTLCYTYLTVLHRKRGNIRETLEYSEKAMEAATREKKPWYIAAAEGNRAWLSWRAGDSVGVLDHAQKALPLWENAHPFQWLARWPLLGVVLAENKITEAVEQARVMLGSTQQKFPDEMETLLETAVSEWDAGSGDSAKAALEQCLPLAQQLGYL